MSSEKRALVVELGGRYVRAGVAGERAPRCVLPWEMAELLGAPRSAADWRRFLYPKLHALCFELMLVNPARRRFVVAEDLLSPRALREALLQVLFTDLKAATVTLVPGVLTALYATASHSALVIDCGWAETRVLPVFKGIPLQHLYQTIPNGSKRCCESLQRDLTSISLMTAEDVLERACFAQQKEPLPVAVVDAAFQTDSSEPLVVPAETRTSAVECLFAGDTVDNASIIEGIRQVVMKTPLDVRASTLSNIVLIGGTAMIPGFASRLVAELSDSLRPDTQSTLLADRIGLAQLYFPRNMLAWVGASVFAATDSARSSAISSSDYESSNDNASLAPDWLAVA